jgi:muramoyltetrapeptide carboxypeptidase
MGEKSQQFTDLRPLAPGRAEGRIFGGNLTVLFAEAAAGRLHIPDGSILLLEDVNETSYRIDRMLTALLDGGHLSCASGVLLGDFVDCSAGKFDVPVSDVLLGRLARLGVPISGDFPSGHGRRNRPLLLGSRASLFEGSVVLQLDC